MTSNKNHQSEKPKPRLEVKTLAASASWFSSTRSVASMVAAAVTLLGLVIGLIGEIVFQNFVINSVYFTFQGLSDNFSTIVIVVLIIVVGSISIIYGARWYSIRDEISKVRVAKLREIESDFFEEIRSKTESALEERTD